jgi:hypothetical protein
MNTPPRTSKLDSKVCEKINAALANAIFPEILDDGQFKNVAEALDQLEFFMALIAANTSPKLRTAADADSYASVFANKISKLMFWMQKPWVKSRKMALVGLRNK